MPQRISTKNRLRIAALLLTLLIVTPFFLYEACNDIPSQHFPYPDQAYGQLTVACLFLSVAIFFGILTLMNFVVRRYSRETDSDPTKPPGPSER